MVERVPVKLTAAAKKQAKKVPKDVGRNLLERVARGQAKPLRGKDHGLYQARVSRYRVAYEERDGFRSVVFIGHKKDVPY